MVIPINRELVIQIHLLSHDEAKGSSSLQHANASYLTCYMYSVKISVIEKILCLPLVSKHLWCSILRSHTSYLTCYLYSADLLIGLGKGIEERGRIEDAGGHTDAQPSMARGDLAEECFHLAWFVSSLRPATSRRTRSALIFFLSALLAVSFVGGFSGKPADHSNPRRCDTTVSPE